jgi:hypothetical protein
MLNGRRGTAIAGALAVAALLMVATPASAIRLGSSLRDVPNAGLCSSAPPALEATCTETQLQLTPGHAASGGLIAEHHGVLTSWQVASGPASPATAGVRMRLRLLRGSRPIAGTATPYVTLPLSEPGIHSFPARLPIDPDDELGLDLSVLGSALAAGSAPIGHSEPRIGEVGEWIPPLASTPQPITNYPQNTELLLAARIEPDVDRDDYGDTTQDRCPYDPRRHSPCLSDGVAPRLTVAYRRRQAFLGTGKILLTVKPNELSQVVASAQLQTPTTTWGLYGDRTWISEGGSAKLLLELPPRPRKAGKTTLAGGGRVYVKCFLTAIDASGNRRHKTIRITPTGS